MVSLRVGLGKCILHTRREVKQILTVKLGSTLLINSTPANISRSSCLLQMVELCLLGSLKVVQDIQHFPLLKCEQKGCMHFES